MSYHVSTLFVKLDKKQPVTSRDIQCTIPNLFYQDSRKNPFVHKGLVSTSIIEGAFTSSCADPEGFVRQRFFVRERIQIPLLKTLNAGLVDLRFFRGSGPVLLRNPKA